jgi:hypothetical protein
VGPRDREDADRDTIRGAEASADECVDRGGWAILDVEVLVLGDETVDRGRFFRLLGDLDGLGKLDGRLPGRGLLLGGCHEKV